MNNWKYLFFSAVISALLSEVILFCNADMMIASGMGTYLTEEELHLVIPVVMAGFSLVVGLTTLKKRKTCLDIGINALTPWIFVLYLFVLKYKPRFTLWFLLAAMAGISYLTVKTNRMQADLPLRRRMRRLYYRCRRFIVVFSMVTMIPAGMYIRSQQQTAQMRLMHYVEGFHVENGSELAASELYFPEEAQWKKFSINEKMEYMEYFAETCFQELGVEAVPFCLNDEMEDRNLACFNYEENLIYVNRNFLQNDRLCSLQNAIYLTAHECYHVAQCQIIKSLMILEEAGFDYGGMEYYEEAVRLADALHSYGEDRKNYQEYKTNEMEVQAEAYGREKMTIATERYH